MRDLQAARYAADRAFRQYDAADPANRLVAGELEARWNNALRRVADVEAKIAEHEAGTPPRLEKAPLSLATLANELKVVWSAPTTDARLKKRIVRTVINEVIADIDADAAEIVLLVHWMGGAHTELRLPRRRRGQRNSTSPDIINAVRQLVLIANDDLIAGILNRNKLRPVTAIDGRASASLLFDPTIGSLFIVPRQKVWNLGSTSLRRRHFLTSAPRRSGWLRNLGKSIRSIRFLRGHGSSVVPHSIVRRRK
jgi:hypothetical protein